MIFLLLTVMIFYVVNFLIARQGYVEEATEVDDIRRRLWELQRRHYPDVSMSTDIFNVTSTKTE